MLNQRLMFFDYAHLTFEVKCAEFCPRNLWCFWSVIIHSATSNKYETNNGRVGIKAYYDLGFLHRKEDVKTKVPSDALAEEIKGNLARIKTNH